MALYGYRIFLRTGVIAQAQESREYLHRFQESQHEACNMQYSKLRRMQKILGKSQDVLQLLVTTTQLSLEKSFPVCDSPSSHTPLPPLSINLS